MGKLHPRSHRPGGGECMDAVNPQSEFEFLSPVGEILLALLDGPKSANQLYKLVSASQPTVSKRLMYLVDKGLVGSQSNPDDLRMNIYFVTPQGLSLVRERVENAILPALNRRYEKDFSIKSDQAPS